MRKIVYVFGRRHYYQNDDKVFGIDYFKEQGYEVEVWSVVRWTFGNRAEDPLRMRHDCVYIENVEQFKSELLRVQDEDCVFLFYPYHAYDAVQAEMRKLICKSGRKFCNLSEQTVKLSGLREIKNITGLDIFKHEIKNISIVVRSYGRYLIQSIRNEKEKNVLWKSYIYPLVYRSSYNFVMGEYLYYSFPNWLEILSKRNVIIPSFDYSDILDCEKIRENKRENYIVYIDQFHMGHSDYKKEGYGYPITNVDKFYQEMNDFFGFLEEKYNAKVIIAAHPKAEYRGDEYGEREIVFYKTISLIKDALLVLSGPSTCIATVAYYKKKLVCITDNQMIRHEALGTRLLDLEMELGTQLCNVSKKDYVDCFEGFISCDYEQYERIVNINLLSNNCQKRNYFYETIFEKMCMLFNE